ncbi:hypothetical protein SLS60_010140 [Paraconiothyrium brasiliense]|uniref:alpha-L-rhamnosidase n=1 Tax=Paraconiothyrium brasiliense TaxID=300254 RepID=A0ABR3QQF5_9PLEO
MSSPQISSPTFEHHFNGLGVDTATPRVSWTFITSASTVRAWSQIAYEVEVSLASQTRPQFYRIESSGSVLVPWPGKALASREAASVRVRVYGKSLEDDSFNPDEPSEWSPPAIVEAALLNPIEDFKAHFITSIERFGPDTPVRPIRFRKEFRLPERVATKARTRLYITAFGVFEAWINGKPVSDELLAPGQIYDGETYDAREEQDNWSLPETFWESGNTFGTKSLQRPAAKLFATNAAPVRITETVACREIFKSKSGKTILDFGQNLVGRLFVSHLQLDEGHEVVFRHAEVMEDDELGVRPLRTAKATDIIVGSGTLIVNWSPKFTFHGFRYAQVDGWPGELSAADIQAQVIHTDMKRRGFFSCSNASVNQLHRNVVWSTRGNFVSLPTDCPQRDERLGWTGDIQAFTPTATFLYDTMGMLESWLQDLAAEQLEDGKGAIPPLVVPEAYMPHWPHMAQAVWDDVIILTPAALYQYSADKLLLERQFESMQAWLDIGIDRAPDGLWNPDQWQLSDWLDPVAPPDDPGNARTDGVLVANEFLIRVTRIFAQLCAALGKSELAIKYTEDAARLKALFQRRYISTEGNLMGSTQTGIGLAVEYDLYGADDRQRETAAAALEKLVRTARFHVATGFAGTPIITHALTTIGKPQLAYRMLLEQTCPSWLYAVFMGATTIWERWDSMLPNRRINPGQMTSFNHYAYGSVADWLHGTVGGISPHEPGWRVIRVRPVPGGNLTSAQVSFNGPYGLVSCDWTWRDNLFEMKLNVPPNCSAVVTLPSEIKRSYSLAEDKEAQRLVYSGVHSFRCEFNAGEWPPKPFIGSFLSMPEDHIAQ